MPVTVKFDPAVYSLQSQVIPDATLKNDGVMTKEQVAALAAAGGGGGGATTLQTFSNATRPAANTVPAGRMIFNTDDNDYNVSNGTDWYNNGNIT